MSTSKKETAESTAEHWLRAVRYDLVPPKEERTRGQNSDMTTITFTSTRKLHTALRSDTVESEYNMTGVLGALMATYVECRRKVSEQSKKGRGGAEGRLEAERWLQAVRYDLAPTKEERTRSPHTDATSFSFAASSKIHQALKQEAIGQQVFMTDILNALVATYINYRSEARAR